MTVYGSQINTVLYRYEGSDILSTKIKLTVYVSMLTHRDKYRSTICSTCTPSRVNLTSVLRFHPGNNELVNITSIVIF